jgi:hypothetical protein
MTILWFAVCNPPEFFSVIRPVVGWHRIRHWTLQLADASAPSVNANSDGKKLTANLLNLITFFGFEIHRYIFCSKKLTNKRVISCQYKRI